jgi:hypothetical protein
VRTPDFVTHYHASTRAPFLNLSDLAEPELATVLRELDAPAEHARSERRFGPRYMSLRRATEDLLRDMFIAAGGEPERAVPHYFVLGASAWFRELYTDPGEVVLPLIELPAAATSFTYPDSITALGLGARYGVPIYPRPYHGRVYRLAELDGVIDQHGLPADTVPASYDGHQRQPFEHFIEIQLWSDAPLAGV